LKVKDVEKKADQYAEYFRKDSKLRR
jgi:hypothetical protein